MRVELEEDVGMVRWKKIPGSDPYEASSSGDVRRAGGLHPLTPTLGKNGYMMVSIGSRKEYVHRLVLMAWVGLPKEGQEASHVDHDKTNNELSNLRWENHEENMARSVKDLKMAQGTKHYAAKLNPGLVRRARNLSMQGFSLKEIKGALGVEVSVHCLWYAIHRVTWKSVV